MSGPLKSGRAGNGQLSFGDSPSMLSVKRAAKAIEHVLLIDEEWAWNGLNTVLGVRLTRKQRIALSVSVLGSLPSHVLHEAIEMLWSASKCPSPPFLSAADESEIWADSAYEQEIEAYLVTCFRRLSDKRKSDFSEFAAAAMNRTQRTVFHDKCEV